MNIQQIHHHLESHQIHPSVQRVAIMQYLFENNMSHPTVEQIYADMLPFMPTLSKATVYNTLRLFVEKKAVVSLFIEERNVRYGLLTTVHAHFRCRCCGCIYDVPLEKSDIPQFKDNFDFSPDEMQIYYWGNCKKCDNSSAFP